MVGAVPRIIRQLSSFRSVNGCGLSGRLGGVRGLKSSQLTDVSKWSVGGFKRFGASSSLCLSRSFSSSGDQPSIGEIIRREIEEEQKLVEKISIDERLEGTKFELDKDSSSDALIALRNGNTLIDFEASSFDVDEEDSPIVQFTATISKDNNQIVFCCEARHKQIEEGEEFDEETDRGIENECEIAIDKVLMPGPDDEIDDVYSPQFADLDHELCNALWDILFSHGIDDALGKTIIDIAKDVENQQYIGWLRNLKTNCEAIES